MVSSNHVFDGWIGSCGHQLNMNLTKHKYGDVHVCIHKSDYWLEDPNNKDGISFLQIRTEKDTPY